MREVHKLCKKMILLKNSLSSSDLYKIIFIEDYLGVKDD